MAHHFLFLLPFFLLPMATSAASNLTTNANMTRGTSITAGGSTSSLSSPSGAFAFGFFPINSTTTNSSSHQLYLLGVWFDLTSPKTLVWAANRNAPVQAGSSFHFTSDGSLSLRNNTDNEIWTPGFFANATNLVLFDDGNLVLTRTTSSSSRAKGFLWQSFSYPTDTLLPGQVLVAGSYLRSQLTDADFSDGRFKLICQTDGNLVLYPLDFETGSQYLAYWASNTVSIGKQLVYNQSGSIYFVLNNGTGLSITSTPTYSPVDFYQRATLDIDGVFRQYVYRKAANTQSESRWKAVSAVPSDICTAVSNLGGSGACGFNSYCSMPDGQLGLAICDCPPQYSFIDPQRKYKGCKPDFVAQSCDKDDSADFDFTPMPNTDWPLSDYTMYMNLDQDQCMQFCLEDCFCVMAAYDPQTLKCVKKKSPLTDGRMGGTEAIALIKVSKLQRNVTSLGDPVALVETIAEKDGRKLFVIGTLFLCLSALLALISFAWLPWYMNTKNSQIPERLQGNMSDLNLRVFTYNELEKATNGFSEEIGRGASGVVYKGVVATSSLAMMNNIAVKKLNRMLQESDKEFKNELRAAGNAHHKNLVKLIGLCEEGTQRLLVYEYMRNGSLMSFLFGGGTRPIWKQRVDIALGVAKGLLYLHDECASQIIHCDIKPQNVLLDDNFAPRISDFGLAKLLRADQTRTTTGIRGTRGYVAPEWFKSMPITNKVDVYSFGVMLLELACCRKNLETDPVDREVEEPVLIYWAYDSYKAGKLRRLLWDDDEEALGDLGKVATFMKVAFWCIQEDPSLRPSMRKVLLMLEGSMTVASPPDPNPFSSQKASS